MPLSKPRPHLLHLLHRFEPCGAVSMAYELTLALRDRRHTLVCATAVTDADPMLVMALQCAGLDVVHVPAIDAAAVSGMGADAAIIYAVDATPFPGVDNALPCICYAYGGWPGGCIPTYAVACSKYAAATGRHGQSLNIDPDTVIPPLLDAKTLHTTAGTPEAVTVAMLCSYSQGKYPYDLASALVQFMPHQTRLLLMQPPVTDDRLCSMLDRRRGQFKTVVCPPQPHMAAAVTAHCDILVYGTSAGYCEPYGRTVMEAMAMGKAVICENKGVFRESLTDKVNALLYDDVDGAISHCSRLLGDPMLRVALGANASLRGAADDAVSYIGQIKHMLRIMQA